MKDQRFADVSRKFKALAHPERLRIVAELMKGECCVGRIQECVLLSQPHVSQSLKILKKAGILESRREKTRICYRVADKTVVRALKILLEGER